MAISAIGAVGQRWFPVVSIDGPVVAGGAWHANESVFDAQQVNGFLEIGPTGIS